MDGKAWQVTVPKSDKLEDVDKLPETLNLPELSQKKKNNRLIASNEIKSVIKKSRSSQKAMARTKRFNRILPNI